MTVTPFSFGTTPYGMRADQSALRVSDQTWNSTAASLGETIRALAVSVLGTNDHSHDPSWRMHMRSLLAPLREAFAQHRAATEGDRGLYADVVHDVPRLARAVDGLVAEHHSLDTAIERLARVADEVTSDFESLRRGAMAVLDDLARHRQNDADLVYEAYTTDIGGE